MSRREAPQSEQTTVRKGYLTSARNKSNKERYAKYESQDDAHDLT